MQLIKYNNSCTKQASPHFVFFFFFQTGFTLGGWIDGGGSYEILKLLSHVNDEWYLSYFFNIVKSFLFFLWEINEIFITNPHFKLYIAIFVPFYKIYCNIFLESFLIIYLKT